MTQPSLGSGPRPGSACGDASALLRRALLALLVVFALATGALPAAADARAPARPAAAPTPAPAPSAPSFVFAPLARGIVQVGEPLTASVVVTDPTDLDLVTASVIVQIAESPVASPAALEGWLSSGEAPGPFAVLERSVLPPVEAGASTVATVTVPADAPGWAGKGPGVYPLTATYQGGPVSRTAVVLQDPAAPATGSQIGIVVPITAQPRDEGLLSAAELSVLTAEGGRLSALLDGVRGTSAVLAIDPAVLASIRVLGTSAPESAVDWLTRLGALPNERFALQYGDADPGLQAEAGLAGPLEPTTLSYAASADDFEGGGVTPAATPSPAPNPAQERPAMAGLPELSDLLDVPGSLPAVWWPAEGRAGDDVVTTLATWAGIDAPPPVTLLSSQYVERSMTQASGAVGDGARVLVYEAFPSAALEELVASSEGRRAAPLAALSAHLALVTGEATGPLLLTTGRLEEFTATSLQGAITAALGHPGAGPVSLAVLAQAPAASVAASAEPDEQGIAALSQLLDYERRIEAFSPIIDDPTLMTAPERTAILQLIGAGWREDDAAWSAAIAAHAVESAAILSAVSIPQPSTIQLISPEAPLRFFVRNDLPWAVNLVLLATPDNLRLDVERSTAVRAEPGVATPVQVPVRARVGSGQVMIELQLRSPTDQQVGPTRSAEVNVRADWEGIGVVTLAAVVSLLLVAGLIRTILRRRRARAAPADIEVRQRAAGADDPTGESGEVPRA